MDHSIVSRWNLADPEEALVFLLWLDCIDRSGILMLEIRHFQANLIHALGVPTLYRPLRFEERYLWGEFAGPDWELPQHWLTVFKEAGIDHAHLEALPNRWIIRYPRHDEQQGKASSANKDEAFLERFFAKEKRNQIDAGLRQELEEIWAQGLWGQDAYRRYNTLCAAQIIKTQVLRDILLFCRRGSIAFGHLGALNGKMGARQERAHLLLARTAVLRRLREQVERLGDLQAQFERTLDLQLQENPRPIVERRREQGMYTSFLAERCFDAYTDIDELVTRFGKAPVETERRGRFARVNLTPLTMHRWHHAYTSSCKLVRDDPAADSHNDTNIHFINTSYWMPDRPDLQVVIAHEISHNIIKESYGQFDAESLSLYRDGFAKLMRLLSHCMEQAGLKRDNPSAPVRSYPDLTLKEVASDLLSASMYDYAYLFALCEEIMGVGLDGLFMDPYGNCDMRMTEHVWTTVAAYEEEREWYYRLRIICEWLKAIDPQKVRSPLAGFLVEGVERTLDGMMEYLAKAAGGAGEESKSYWVTLTNRMCEIVRGSEAAQVVKQWREDNRNQNKRMDDGQAELRRVSRHMRRLPIAVRRMLYQDVIRKKTGENRALHFWESAEHDRESAASLCRKFEEFYFGIPLTPDITIGGPPIYRHLRDIPWETHMLRAIDFVHKATGSYNRVPNDRWISVAMQQAAPGRGIYKVALEFHYWLGRSPTDRLSAAIRLLETTDFAAVGGDQEVVSKLSAWAGENVSKQVTVDSVKALYEYIKKYLREGATYRKAAIDKILGAETGARFTARLLLLAHPANPQRYAGSETTRIEMFVLEHLQGEKLEQLGDIIDKAEGSLRAELGPLREYLEVRHKKDSQETEEMLGSMLHALSANCCSRVNNSAGSGVTWREGLPDIQTYSLGRIAVTGAEGGIADARIEPADPASELPDPPDIQTYSLGRIAVTGALGRIAVTGSLGRIAVTGAEGGRGGSKREQLTLADVFAQGAWQAVGASGTREFHPVLGANDIMSVAVARPTQRWPLPTFTAGGGGDPCTEKFMRFFERRERAIPVRHKPGQRIQLPRKNWVDGRCPDDENPPFIAFLSVFLSQRSLRMDFVWRLLRENGSFQELAACLREDDYVFLGQGLGDIILMFGAGSRSENRLQEIFRVQNTLYEDFMVDRTELILSPICLHLAAMQPDAYEVIVQCRTRESRYINKCNDDITHEIMEHNRGDFRLCRTPGRMDFTIIFNDLSRFLDKRRRPILKLYDIFGKKWGRIDDIVTTIGCRYLPTSDTRS